MLASLGKLVQKTQTCKNNYNPSFGETFEFKQHRPGEEVLLRVMDWHRMSKDTLVGAARLNLDSCVDARHTHTHTHTHLDSFVETNLTLKLPLLNANGSPIKGHNDQATVLILRVMHVKALDVRGEKGVVSGEARSAADPAHDAADDAAHAAGAHDTREGIKTSPAGEGERSVPSLFAAQHAPPPGSASVRQLSATFECSNKSISAQNTPTSSAGDRSRFLEEGAERGGVGGGGGGGGDSKPVSLQTQTQTQTQTHTQTQTQTQTRPSSNKEARTF